MPHPKQSRRLLCPTLSSLTEGKSTRSPLGCGFCATSCTQQWGLADNIPWVSSLRATYSSVIIISIYKMEIGFSLLPAGAAQGQKAPSCLHHLVPSSKYTRDCGLPESMTTCAGCRGLPACFTMQAEASQVLPQIYNHIVVFKGCVGSDKTMDSLLIPFILTSTTSPCKCV